MKPRHCILFLAALLLLIPPARAQYNPAKDNPYVKPAGGDSKKWYEFYKPESPSSPYIQKTSGYWRSAKEDNEIVKGVKWVGTTVKEILQAALNG